MCLIIYISIDIRGDNYLPVNWLISWNVCSTVTLAILYKFLNSLCSIMFDTKALKIAQIAESKIHFVWLVYENVVTKGLEKTVFIIIQLNYTIQGVSEISVPREQVCFPEEKPRKTDIVQGNYDLADSLNGICITVILYQYQQSIRKISYCI